MLKSPAFSGAGVENARSVKTGCLTAHAGRHYLVAGEIAPC